jgi:hypothetical protein
MYCTSKTENIVTSNANMVNPIKSLYPQPSRSNPFVKLSTAARQPMRELFKTNSGGTSSTNSVTSTATESNQQAVKFVRFSGKNQVCKTLSRMNYTLEESKATWLSLEECQQIWRQCNKEIKKIDYGKKFKDKKYCARGLEGQTRIGSVSRERNKASAFDAVFEEQSMQWEEGVFDEDTIAEVYYRASSRRCQRWASLVGRRDHRAAKGIHGSSYEKSSSSHYHHHEQTTRCSNDALEQSLVAPCAA